MTEALHALQLTLDLSQEVLGKAAELGSNKAQAAAAQVVHALGAQAADETADDQVKRQRLASESYALKVKSRPKQTTSQYAGVETPLQGQQWPICPSAPVCEDAI